jgi:hypothetical protein
VNSWQNFREASKPVRRPALPVTLSLAITTAAVCAGWLSAAPLVAEDVGALMTRVGARVEEYQRRANRIMCVEESTVQPIQNNLSPIGTSRTVQSELRLESETAGGAALPDPKLLRSVLRINGRAPSERDLQDRSGCTDPDPLSPAPLAFLLPAHQSDYRFTSLRTGRERDRAAMILDFVSTTRTGRLALVEDPRGHDDCFDWSGPLATNGRIWVDAQTNDVLRVDRHIGGPVDIFVAPRLQQRYGFSAWVTLDRDDQSLRYRPVAFHDPDEIVLLPVSIDSLTTLRGGLQSIRRTQTFKQYRRFLATTGYIVKTP